MLEQSLDTIDDNVESFYDSPLNCFWTKSPVLKQAPGRARLNTASHPNPTSLFNSPLQTRKYAETFH